MTTSTQLLGTRFGAIEFSDEDVVTFPEGIIGFADFTAFVLLSHKPDSPFRWLQSVEEAAVAFLIVDPSAYIENYEPEISNSDASGLKLREETPRMLFSTASIPGGNAEEMTLNLAAPIVINLEARIGKQVVLEGDAYNIRHRVFPKANSASGLKAA
jgi:flagellar assembly factor FliW